ncbi:MAG TPA: PD-(D/E)XK nuclease family protein [Cyclobacteriaceae bacterium]|nr:PD-(D/E)XK nuclease family protein [Cyclobacteriaceae bacterium]HMV10281.1 PD-(D/E)XK nuclease family protein [Cyclobacteriaceae bacterium]HMV89651.1 PD-(D/E)XK nuclease family protein [Cyclobacteriaceae bacterium]HMW99761.1 PD-(D/E)XK nuclease family protein [Cyclobacteriaceae bacterium]HMX50153.1 PD-(D/E)XK nuclease family protein [Cyclobacteriaceae bacterium]
MKPFLYDLAEKLYRDHAQPESVTLVFPNRRASLYFRKYFSQIIEKPVFSPRLITVEEFITAYSPLRVPDKLELIHRLYKAYRTVTHTEEQFDRFYFWGEMLIRDFDEVDKYMVNAPLLFQDLSNQKELDSRFDFLTPEQLEFLKEFWGNFDGKDGATKHKFLQLWRQLPDVYGEFKRQLKAEGLAYEGLIHREVADAFVAGTIKPENSPNFSNETWFVGFNALTGAEEKMLTWFVANTNAQIHWDLDDYYLNNKTQEAGEFFREYQSHHVLGRTFPANAPVNFSTKKNMRVIGAAQPVGQAKIMSQLLQQELENGMIPEETLIVLPDEKLMLPVLHGISASVDKLNVTMGYPLTNTPMFNLIELLIELQTHRRGDFYHHRQVLSLLNHPHVISADPASANEKRKRIQGENWVMVPGSMLRTDHVLQKLIFCEATETSILEYLRQVVEQVGSLQQTETVDKEFAVHFLRFLNRMEDVLGATYSSLKAFLQLFRQLVKTQKIPFTGEPLRGLQVMGVLETRNLDFKNVFILSLNEGSLPSGSGKGSYIPYNIRKAYQLPTVEHQDSIYAYLFYRVMQRAENVFLFYNSETDQLGQGEMSRYLQQLLYESGIHPDRQVLHNPIQPLEIKPIVIQKDAEILESLNRLNEGNVYFKGISPSALNTYLECRLQFYFRYIAKVREPNEVEEDIDARIMGTFLHDVMELFYKRIREKKRSKEIIAGDFDRVESDIDALLDEVFIKKYNLDPAKKVEFEGQRLVVREVVKRFALRILEMDKAYTPFVMEAVEQAGVLYRIKIDQSPGYAVVGGKIDRVDRKDGLLRIIDYKTGKDRLDFESVASLFARDGKRNKAAFQTLIYALLYQTNISPAATGLRVSPGLINRLNLFEEAFEFGLKMAKAPVNDVKFLLLEFEDRLRKLLEEIFNPEATFDQTTVIETCRICPYRNICYR